MKCSELPDSKAVEQYFTEALPQYSRREAQIIFKALAQKFWQWPERYFITGQELALNRQQCGELRNWIDRLGLNEPYQYLVGEVSFAEMPIKVTPAALIPRPETEELLNGLINRVSQPGTALDIGTGSGCLALGIKKRWPQCEVSGWDISKPALELAALNAHNLQLNINWQKADALKINNVEDGRGWDIIVSNPPYVSAGEKGEMAERVLHYEPGQALFAQGDDPLIFYRSIAAYALKSLNTSGILALELNQYLAKEIVKIVEAQGFKVEPQRDMAGNWRFLWAMF